MTRPQLDDPREKRRRRLVAQWTANMLLLAMLVLLGSVVYLASIVGHLDDRMKTLIQVDKDTKSRLDEHVDEVDKHTEQSESSHCALLRTHDLDAPCPSG